MPPAVGLLRTQAGGWLQGPGAVTVVVLGGGPFSCVYKVETAMPRDLMADHAPDTVMQTDQELIVGSFMFVRERTPSGEEMVVLSAVHRPPGKATLNPATARTIGEWLAMYIAEQG
jgi:hypothetical protein